MRLSMNIYQKMLLQLNKLLLLRMHVDRINQLLRTLSHPGKIFFTILDKRKSIARISVRKVYHINNITFPIEIQFTQGWTVVISGNWGTVDIFNDWLQ